MLNLFRYLFLRVLFKTALVKVNQLESLHSKFLWSRLIFTKSDLELINSSRTHPNKKQPSISVILIHHDPSRLPWLSECLYSLKSQYYKNFEVVLIVNYKITSELRNLLEKFTNVKVFFYKNSHPSQARNIGVQQSDSELVLFVDDDNLLLPWHVLFILNAYKNNPKAEIYFGSFICFENETLTHFPLRYLVSKSSLLLGDPTDVSSVAVKRSSFPAIQWDDQVLSENWAFFVDAFDRGFRVHQISAPLSLHRIHSQSRSITITRPLIPSNWFQKYRNQINWDLKIPESSKKVKLLKIIHAIRTINVS